MSDVQFRGPDAVADIIAAAFHDHYERLAPEHGYETREASRKAWSDVPEQNRALMRATVLSLINAGLIAAPTAVRHTLDDALDDLPRYMAVTQPENGWLPSDGTAGPTMRVCLYIDDVREMLRRKVGRSS